MSDKVKWGIWYTNFKDQSKDSWCNLDGLPKLFPSFEAANRDVELFWRRGCQSYECYEARLYTPADVVAHPPHYTSHPSKVECIQITEHMNFCRGNALKYLWRAGEKDKAKEEEDLRKAHWYLERELDRCFPGWRERAGQSSKKE